MMTYDKGCESEECENVGYGMTVLKLRFGGVPGFVKAKEHSRMVRLRNGSVFLSL